MALKLVIQTMMKSVFQVFPVFSYPYNVVKMSKTYPSTQRKILLWMVPKDSLFLENKLVSQTSTNFLELDYYLLATTMRHICRLVDICYYMTMMNNIHSTVDFRFKQKFKKALIFLIFLVFSNFIPLLTKVFRKQTFFLTCEEYYFSRHH